jgi:glycosyltransferase involved in cell wall biosynthesis
MQNYTIIIPAFNEGKVIGKVLDSMIMPEGCAEIIVIDDGSKDNTYEEASARDITVIKHHKNKGYGAALKTGINACKTPYLILYDGDGQHRIEDLLSIAKEMHNYDMLVGARSKSSHQPLIRRPGKKILSAFVNLLSQSKIPDINSGLRAFKTDTIKRYLHLMPNGFSFSTTSTVALNSMGYDVAYTPIVVQAREGSKSSVKIFKDGFRALMLILNLTVLFNPLKVFVPMSLAFMGGSVLYFIYYSIIERVHVTTSMALMGITGVLIFFMGIICEQVSAMRRELNNR